ncbi:DUF817 domain-containing protein [Enterovirga sp.]|uniref:DUF817 domain-containing protein n=1 Tax=Enterovirga sp. TaxID=2026350 RepID=UPI002D190FA8|nr:DUF817 domain-containing protein [Enterovirga sp.]HMO31212.1 DUF817 domain-containing protein [Enterovirga sp.]
MTREPPEPSASRRRSAARLWEPLAAFIGREEALGRMAEARGPWIAGLYEFLRFGMKQGWACLFGGLMVALLIGTHLFYPKGAALARYDFLTLAALFIQAMLLWSRMETLEEAKVILVFHVVGTAMELFKTSAGSWIYPEAGFLRIGGVPLFTGFMYACVGSYIARAWRLFDFRFTHHPGVPAMMVLSIAIYVNFFSHHYLYDVRYMLFLATAVLFGRTFVYFKVWRVYRRMPLLLGFLLVSCFIYLAENVGTFTGTWLYPNQYAAWALVSPAKLGSWFLLMIISYSMVAAINGVGPAASPSPAASTRGGGARQPAPPEAAS